jgi:diguanylate cyclase (GGDEF)-like protein
MSMLLEVEDPQAMADALTDALDLVEFGILFLTPDLRVRFINRSLKQIWGFKPSVLQGHPTYRSLLQDAARRGMYAMPPDCVQAFIDRREAQVADGSVSDATIDLSDGRRLAFRCHVTRDGGRLLTSIDVTGAQVEIEHQREASAEAARLGAELRFSNETLESQAAYLAALAESADEAAHKADEAKRRLEQEIAERAMLEAELRRVATTDALTGALNRAQFFKLGERELSRVRSVGQEAAVLMLDIDYFKRINDEFGHAAGDATLREIVVRLHQSVRQIDLIGRLGGEEFGLVLPAIPAHATMQVAERLRTAIANRPVQAGDRQIPITASIGIALLRETDVGLEQVLARADSALYAAKHAGRDCVRSADPSTEDVPPG